MDKKDEKILAEVKEALDRQSCDGKTCEKCSGKTPIEKRWNIEVKDKPSEA